MRTALMGFIICLGQIPLFSFTKPYYQCPYNEKSNVIEFCKLYAAAYVPLLEGNYSSPNTWTRYVGDRLSPITFNSNNKNQLLEEFETIIHESTHQKNSRDVVYVSPQAEFYTSTEEKNLILNCFKSERIGEFFSEEQKESIFRFNTYIGLNNSNTSNVYGIWGLLDEFTAYQNGCSASLMAYEKALSLKDTATALIFIKESIKTYFAYFEFRAFIGAYLKYAKEYEADFYQELLQFTALRKAFTLNSNLFLSSHYKINQSVKRLKRHYSSIQWLYEYNQKTYEKPAVAAMNAFKPELEAFSAPFELEYAWAKPSSAPANKK